MGAPTFQARFEVASVTFISANLWELAGDVYDTSGAGFQPDDALANDLVFDEDSSTFVGFVNCWKVTSIISRHTPNYTSLVCRVAYNEPGSPGGVGEPLGGSCAICRATSTGSLDLSQAPSPGFTLISDTLSNSIRNYDARVTTEAGVQGPQGLGGPQGISGPQGTSGTNGVQGPQGILGTDGVQGPQGTLGVDGIQGAQGRQGTLGIDGTQGPQGADGIGTQGRQGWQGLGSDGVQGPQGNVGIGTQGPQGDLGVDGVQGAQGWQGSGADALVASLMLMGG